MSIAAMPLPPEDQHELIVSHCWLVEHLARKMPSRMSLEDKIANGNVGVVEAARRFDPGLGVQFSTYAAFWIKAHIRLADIDDSIAPDSKNGRKILYGLRRAIHSLEVAGIEPTDERVAQRLGVPVDMLAMLRPRLLQADTHIESLEQAGGAGHHGSLVSDANPERDVIALDDQIKRMDRIGAALQLLTPLERDIVKRRYLTDSPETLSEIGDDHGCTREWIRQLEERALKKLRTVMRRDD